MRQLETTTDRRKKNGGGGEKHQLKDQVQNFILKETKDRARKVRKEQKIEDVCFSKLKVRHEIFLRARLIGFAFLIETLLDQQKFQHSNSPLLTDFVLLPLRREKTLSLKLRRQAFLKLGSHGNGCHRGDTEAS